MTVQELIDALVVLGSEQASSSVILVGDGVFRFEAQSLSVEDDQVIISSTGAGE